MRISVTALLLILLLPQAMANSSEPPANFMEAKKQMVKIFSKLNNPTTLYCGCKIVFTKRGYKPDLQSCGYEIDEDYERGNRIEAEHIVPVWEFAHGMNCWTQVPKGSGYRLCRSASIRLKRSSVFSQLSLPEPLGTCVQQFMPCANSQTGTICSASILFPLS